MRKFTLDFCHKGVKQKRECVVANNNGQYLDVTVLSEGQEPIEHVLPMVPAEDVVVRYNVKRELIEIGDRISFNFTRFGVV